MAGFVANKVAKHVLKENAQNHFGTEDPYFDHVTPFDLNGHPGKVQKTKKAAPPGLTAAETKVLKKVTRRAYRLDNCISICGIRVGWEAVIGIIPGLGDVFGVLMAMMVYRTACQADLPAAIKSKMVMNIVLDFLVGLVPLLGDVADAVFKSNTRNASLLYIHLRERGAARIKAGGADGAALSGQRTPPRTITGHTTPPRTGAAAAIAGSGKTSYQQPQQQQPLVSPAPAYGQQSGTVPLEQDLRSPQHAQSKSGNKGGFLSRFGGGGGGGVGGKPERDVEAGDRV